MSQKYLRWIRQQPCAICENDQAVHAHHQIGSKTRGVGYKASDFRVIPLCAPHHLELHNHGHITWEEIYGITQDALIVNYLTQAISEGVLVCHTK